MHAYIYTVEGHFLYKNKHLRPGPCRFFQMRKPQLSGPLAKRTSNLNSIFGVKKPAGESSAQIVAVVKNAILNALSQGSLPAKEFRALKSNLKVGHGGTLDPIATGVLVIGVGNGCKRLQEYLQDTQKSYRAICRFGRDFDTYDRTGVVMEERPFDNITREQIEEALREKFTGTIMQKPPAFSALRINGERAYDIARKRQISMVENVNNEKKARAGRDINETKKTNEDNHTLLSHNLAFDTSGGPLVLPERQVTISRLELKELNLPEFVIEMDCSSGTYVRSLIHDLGLALGSVAAMYELERTAQGPITVEECVELSALTDPSFIEKLLFITTEIK